MAEGKVYVDFLTQQYHYVSDWLHRFDEDRFRINARPISDMSEFCALQESHAVERCRERERESDQNLEHFSPIERRVP